MVGSEAQGRATEGKNLMTTGTDNNSTAASRRSVLRAEGFSCPSCVTKIEKQVGALSGVNAVKVYFNTSRIVVDHDPEVASVGLTEEEAKEQYGEVDSYEFNLGGNGKSQILGTTGFVKLVRQKNGPIVGVHMLGARMGEQIGEAQLMVNWEAFPEDVAKLIHAHPTQNESLGEAARALAGMPLHAM